MFKQLKTYLNIGPKIYGIEVFEHNGTLNYEVVSVKRSKNELLISTSHTFTDWQDVVDGLDAKTPICLCYNTEDVLHKMVSAQAKYNDTALIEQVFPNIVIERFYYNISPFHAEHYLALVEKAKIDAVIKNFEGAKLHVVNYSIGLSVLTNLLDYFVEDTIHTTTKTLVIDKGRSEDTIVIQPQKGKIPKTGYEINGLHVDHTKLLGLGAVIDLLNQGAKKNYLGVLNAQQEKFKYTRAFQVLLWPIVAFFFVLLLANFLVFNHYYTKSNDLEVELNSNNTNKEKLIGLKESLIAKEKRVEAILTNNNSRSTLFMDAIAQSIPNSVLLENLVYQPISKPIKKDEAIAQDFNEIYISGETNDTEAFSNWIVILEDFEWVSQVETISFGFKSKNSSIFSLKITVNE